MPIIVEFNRRLARETERKTLDLATVTAGVAAVARRPDRARGRTSSPRTAATSSASCMITFEWSDWRNGWFWWIQSVYVRADARRQGVFRTLYEHVAAEALRCQDVVGIRLYVEHANNAAQATYERMGMEDAGYFVLERCPL